MNLLASTPGMESFFIVLGVIALIFGIAYFVSDSPAEE